jgi:PPM family protein phosphatase
LVRDGAIRQLSTDHTWIQEALDAGLITPEQTRNHPNAHVIRRYLGSRQPVEPDTRLRLQATETDEQALANQGTSLLPGDQLLLCSDGLTDLVSGSEILSALQENTDQKKAIQVLVDRANQRGGHDNITIVALRMPASSRPKPLIQAARRANLNWNCLAIAAILAILVIAVLVGALIYVQVFTSNTSPTATLTQPALTQTQPLITTEAPLPEVTPTSPIVTATVEPATLTPWPTNTLPPTTP